MRSFSNRRSTHHLCVLSIVMCATVSGSDGLLSVVRASTVSERAIWVMACLNLPHPWLPLQSTVVITYVLIIILHSLLHDVRTFKIIWYLTQCLIRESLKITVKFKPASTLDMCVRSTRTLTAIIPPDLHDLICHSR
eukprot:Blabericola_migrator_1__2680@NODE_1760_length_3829_cov_10_833333_g1137_i0_p3_GENE_NODE_1760_length_3829_cov_10_833333_g1137_i0NODE_1760_length_3829_cov_10_833333_g1137_i0_p3_ORF_typecomplete_len137_score0_52HCV_NS2/PF01538_18/5_4e03HCV_NS2/PF01538_18/0_0077Zds_C/PF08632_10/0_051_NODE_1760_length_3829_cov_10_833333_g1137_i013801790